MKYNQTIRLGPIDLSMAWDHMIVQLGNNILPYFTLDLQGQPLFICYMYDILPELSLPKFCLQVSISLPTPILKMKGETLTKLCISHTFAAKKCQVYVMRQKNHWEIQSCL